MEALSDKEVVLIRFLHKKRFTDTFREDDKNTLAGFPACSLSASVSEEKSDIARSDPKFVLKI